MDKKIQGLSVQEVTQQEAAFGKNKITTEESLSLLNVLFSQFLTVITIILAIAAFLSFVTGNHVDGIIICITILLNGLLGFFQEYQAERSLQKLKHFVVPVCKVFRDGQLIELPVEDIVPGDFISLNEGDRLPADGKIVSETHIELDESMLTGESLPVIKKIQEDSFCGTLVVKGKAILHIDKIGDQTRLGQITKTLASIKAEITPLQKQINRLTKTVSLIAIGLVGLFFVIGLFQGHSLIPLTLLVVSIGVAAIPESLPAVITVALAIGSNRMAANKAIIRKLSAVETIGMAQIILTDKTGTLTQNKMQVKDFFVYKKSLFSHMVQVCLFGNTAMITKEKVVGDRTDAAVLLWATQQDAQKNWEHISIQDEYVFDSLTKTITTVIKNGEKFEVFVRGAPEIILEKSTLSGKEKEIVGKKIEIYASQGYRIIGCGYKLETHKQYTREHVEGRTTFLGFLVLYDPPRIEAKQAVIDAHTAGIQVVMVTGDNSYTALAIAKEVGIADTNEQVITGQNLAILSDEDVKKLLLTSHVFARMSPEDKLRLTHLCKEQYRIVGVTGDGMNDTLALKAADVGIAMGESGSDVAREASDIILTNDSFAVIVTAIAEGRTIYANIVKAIIYLLAGNLSELTLIFGAFLLHMPFPLLPTQVLWVNLVTDGLPALALANDTKQVHVMKDKPRGQSVPMLTNKRLVFIFLTGLLMGTTFLSTFFLLLSSHVSEIQSRTIVFNMLILFHLFLVFVIRRKTLFKLNWFFVITILLTIFLQILITLNPFFKSIFHLSL